MTESRKPLADKGVAPTSQTVLPPCLPDSTEADPDLALVVEAWPGLPEAVRAGIVAMVKAAT